jgi:hypothetical protein
MYSHPARREPVNRAIPLDGLELCLDSLPQSYTLPKQS